MSARSLRILGKAIVITFAMLLTEAHGQSDIRNPSHVDGQLPEAPKRSAVIAAGGFLVPGDQVKKMFIGNTVYYIFLAAIDAPRGAITAVYYSDARTRVVKGLDGKSYQGLWWMEGDAVCKEHTNRSGHLCFLIYETKDMTLECNRDKDLCYLMLRSVPGNVEKLSSR